MEATVLRTSTNKFIDVSALSKKIAIKFIGISGIFKEISAHASIGTNGVYVFRRIRINETRGDSYGYCKRK